MMEGYCIACQYGQHDEHIDYPEKPSRGGIGGWHCPCKGECAEEYAKRMPNTNVQALGNESHQETS